MNGSNMKKNTIRDMAHVIAELKKVSARNKDKDKNGDFLSQWEVEELLRSVVDEDSCLFDPEDYKSRSDVREYNLGTQERIVRGRMPTLELINERFARSFRVAYFDKFRRSAEISVGPIRVQKYSEFVRNLVVPTNLNLINFNSSLPGAGLIIFDPNFVFLTVDNVFGGDGRFHTRVEGRDFTPIERMVIMEIFNVFTDTYTGSFNPVYPLEMSYIRSEMNSQFASVATPSEIVVTTTFTVEIAGACADMHICIPYNSYEKIIPLLNSTLTPDIGSTLDIGNIPLHTIPHTLNIMAESVEQLTVSDVRKLKSGDFIPFTHYNAYIETKHIFQGEHTHESFTITHIKEK